MASKKIVGAIGLLIGLTLSTAAIAESLDKSPIGVTDRRVSGIITALDTGKDNASVTITPLRGRTTVTVTGRVEEGKTKITLNGHPAKLSDLRVTFSARGELNLDEVWVALAVDGH